MFRGHSFPSLAAAVALILCAAAVHAVTIDVVPVGNPGNSGELSGKSAIGGYGPNRVCGAVNYSYSIGTYEVTAGQYTEFLNAVAGVDTYGLYSTSMWSSKYGCKIERYEGNGTIVDPYLYRVAVDYAFRPVNYVSWGDAARFCNWLHNGQPAGVQDNSTTEDGAYFLDGAISDAALLAVTRKVGWKCALPTEDEWYKAAYHKNDGATGNYFHYPTRNERYPGRDLTEAVKPGNNANYFGNQSPFPIDAPYYTTLAGEFELSSSAYGTFDQGGNVWEWIEGVMFDTKRGVRGGAYNGVFLSLQASDRYSFGLPANEDSHIGFRVTGTPEPGVNLPPAVDPGGPYSGAVGQPVQFDASGTTDPEGDPLIYFWYFGDGSTPPMPDPSPTAAHTYTQAGTYTAQLTVSDGMNDPVVVEFTVEIDDNAPPQVDPGGPYSGGVGQPVQFDASGTTDPEGDPLMYQWDFGDGSTPPAPDESPIATHTYTQGGTYTAQLTVADDVNDPVAVEFTVEIDDNSPPQVDPGGPYWGVVGGPVQFDASGTIDPEGDPLIYQWDFGDGSMPPAPDTSPTAAHTYTQGGTYTAQLTVSDGMNDPVVVEFTVEIDDNLPPVVDPGGPYSGVAGRSVRFDASGTTDPEGDPLTYMWDFGDGSTPPAPNPSPIATHAYTQAGTYTAQLAVVDGVNDPVAVEFTVEIDDGPTPGDDVWTVKIPFLFDEFQLELEQFAGILLTRTTPPGEATTIGIGMETDGIIFWMDVTGAIFFGNVDRTAGTMRGIVFDHRGGSSIWFAERL